MKIYYIDPQSANNTAIYDRSLLSGMTQTEVVYYNSVLYNIDPLERGETRCVFNYNICRNVLVKSVSYVRSLLAILRDARRERPDIVHIQWIRIWPIDMLFIFLLHLLKVKVVFTAHNILPHNEKSGDKFKFTRYYKALDAVIVHAERTRDEMAESLGIDKKKIFVKHHGIIDNSFDADLLKQRMSELRSELGIPADALVFSSMGLQNHYKGTDLIVKAWEKDMFEREDCHLLVVGRNDGIDFSSIASHPRVHVVSGTVPFLDFEAYLRLSSVVLLPYRKISQSGVLFSAIQAGIPCLVADVGGLPEPLQFGNIGWNMGEATKDNLLSMMQRLSADIAATKSLAAHPEEFQKVCEAYSWPSIAAETEALYRELVK